jgi:hypothetical protein
MSSVMDGASLDAPDASSPILDPSNTGSPIEPVGTMYGSLATRQMRQGVDEMDGGDPSFSAPLSDAAPLPLSSAGLPVRIGPGPRWTQVFTKDCAKDGSVAEEKPEAGAAMPGMRRARSTRRARAAWDELEVGTMAKRPVVASGATRWHRTARPGRDTSTSSAPKPHRAPEIGRGTMRSCVLALTPRTSAGSTEGEVGDAGAPTGAGGMERTRSGVRGAGAARGMT